MFPTLNINFGNNTTFLGPCAFATAFVYADTGQFVRTDKPVEVSNIFTYASY